MLNATNKIREQTPARDLIIITNTVSALSLKPMTH